MSLKWMKTKQYYINPHLFRRGGMVSSIATSLLAKKMRKKEGGQEEYKRTNKRMKG